MALPTTNLRFSQINTELEVAANTRRSMDNINTRILASVGGTGVSFTAGTTIRASSLRQHAYVSYSRTNGVNVNVFNDVSSVEYVSGKTWVQYFLSGTVGSSTSTPAATISNFTSTDRIEIYNNAWIQGKGGSLGGPNAGGGGAGGNALTVSCPVIFTNNYRIYGGGGGGGGGAFNPFCQPFGAAGGAGGNGQGYGQSVSGGQPGVSVGFTCRGGNGGPGGDWGNAGSNGEAAGANGGAAGTSVVGNGFINWLAVGDLRGAVT